MRTFVEVRALLSEDDEQQDAIFKGSFAIDDNDEGTSSTFASGRFTIAAEEEDFEVPFVGVTDASYVLILAYQEIQVKLGGADQVAHPVRPKAASTAAEVLSDLQTASQPGMLLLTGKVSSIHVTNPSTTDEASFRVVLVGEAT